MKDFKNNEWGLVFAGGGGKGAYQIGVWRALKEKLIDDYITMVSGSSVGALNAVLFGSGDLETAQNIWGNITPKQFLEIDPELIDFNEGFVSRDGLMEIFNNYIDFAQIYNNQRELYATATEFDEKGEGEGIARYFRLNYKSKDEIVKILLASSALPFIYEPVEINGFIYRDGGLKDNIPVMPLYIEGIRHFFVVGLSPESSVNEEKYGDAEIIMIKPHQSIGDFINGTLDFTSKGAKLRMELGYVDGIRAIEFAGADFEIQEIKKSYEDRAKSDYSRLFLKNNIDEDMEKINSLINRYT